MGQFIYKIWKLIIKITCYPISITTRSSDRVLNLNLVKLCIQYNINATNNTTAAF